MSFKAIEAKVDFPEMEKRILTWWREVGIVEKYLQKNNSSKQHFSFLDGPITANNPMGVHHAWGRTYKDLWQRFFNMRGFRQRFQNGFDCQGLWVEVEVEKELGLKNKKEIEALVPGDKKASIAKFVEFCKERVFKYADIQTKQSKRLGYFMDWENSYFTMSDENNYMIWHFLKVCHERGWIYKGLDSVPWCPRCETAISQHEILTENYKEAIHESVYLEFPLVERKNEFLLVWTTTPWTIPANIAIAVDEKLDYALVEGATGCLYWSAKDLAVSVFGQDYKRIVKTVPGKELVGLEYKAPFDHLPSVSKVAKENPNTFHKVVATDKLIMPVTTNEGTGLVHIAVSAGAEDFKLGQKLKLPMIPVIADNADYLEGLGFLSGKNAKSNPRIILDYLEEEDKKEGVDWVFNIAKYRHRYPVCWRCKIELVWKVTEEWYIAMDKKATAKPSRSKLKAQSLRDKTLREQMVEVAKTITWIPGFGLERELDWLSNMNDWLISKKNRYWGLALPIWECEECGGFEVIGSKEELEGKAVQGWDEFKRKTPHKPYIDEVKIKCGQCGAIVSRIESVGNPWLDAGIIPFSTITRNNKGEPLYLKDRLEWKSWFPANFITESFPGQFKNWFYSMLAMSTALEKTNPFKTVLGYGTLLAEDARPMHKSWGNAIEFNEGADKIGVDIMRWLYAKQNPADNLLFGYNKANLIKRQFHLLLWNSYNFFATYAGVENWEPKKAETKKTPAAASQIVRADNILDDWILSRLAGIVKETTEKLESFDAAGAVKGLEDFVVDFSRWYIRRSRDRVGPSVENSQDKEDCYQTLYFVLLTLTKLLAPFTPFIAEEIYQNLNSESQTPNSKLSVHLEDWPKVEKERLNKKLEVRMKAVREIVELGHAERKKLGMPIRQPLNKLKVTTGKMSGSGYFAQNSEFKRLIRDELNVKKIEWIVGEVGEVGQREEKESKLKKTGKDNSEDIGAKQEGERVNISNTINTSNIRVELDTEITPELKAEGKARGIVREIQMARRKAGIDLDSRVRVTLAGWPKEFEDLIKKKTLAGELKEGNGLAVEKL